MIEQAINTGGFYKEAKTLAGIRSIHSQLSRVIAAQARGGPTNATDGPTTPSDVDGAPSESDEFDEETAEPMDNAV